MVRVRVLAGRLLSHPRGVARTTAGASLVAASAVLLALLVAPGAAASPIGEADHNPAPAVGGPAGDLGHGHDHGAPALSAEDAPASGSGEKRDTGKKKDPPADVPLPPGPEIPANLSPEVDPLADYQGQYICSPEPKVGADRIAAIIRATYEEHSDIWIPRDCNEGGRSEHKEGRAIDWMINQRIPEQNAQAQSFLNWLLATDENGNEFAMARRLGVMYIGWGDEIWESYTQEWSELKGCYSTPQPDYDTYCHRNHIHISLSWDGAAAQTSFWGGTPTPASYCSPSHTPSTTAADPGDGLDFIPTVATRLLDTRIGQGLDGQVCRLAADSSGGEGAPVVLKVGGRKGAPPVADLRAVAVRVTTLGSNSPATLRTATGGTLDSVAMNARREAVTILPVATDGTVSFTSDSGATHLTVDLLGYFVVPGSPSATAAGGRLLPSSNSLAYDTVAQKSPLQPGEKRVVDLGSGDSSGGPPAGALLTLTATNATKAGQLVIRRTGDKRTVATPVLPYRRNDTISTSLLAALDAEGRVTIVNLGSGPVDISLAVQATAVRTAELGSLLVPVKPSTVRAKPTTLAAVLGEKPPRPRPAGEPDRVDSADQPGAIARSAVTREPRISSTVKGATAAVLQVRVEAAKKGGQVTFWSLGEPKVPSMIVPRQSTITGLVIVPLSADGTLRRTIVGDLDVTARVVAYLR